MSDKAVLHDVTTRGRCLGVYSQTERRKGPFLLHQIRRKPCKSAMNQVTLDNIRITKKGNASGKSSGFTRAMKMTIRAN